MAFIKCSGGGKLKETLLWENPNPTKSFAQQEVILNYDINNFEYLKFCNIYLTTDTTKGIEILISPDIFKNQGTSSSVKNTNLCFTGTSADVYKRYIYPIANNSTKIKFGNSIYNDGNSQNNKSLVPTFIYGLKY